MKNPADNADVHESPFRHSPRWIKRSWGFPGAFWVTGTSFCESCGVINLADEVTTDGSC